MCAPSSAVRETSGGGAGAVLGRAVGADVFGNRWGEEAMPVPRNVEATPGGVTVVPAALQDTLALPRWGADGAILPLEV